MSDCTKYLKRYFKIFASFNSDTLMNSEVSAWQDYNQKQRMRREQKEITGAIDGFKEAIPSYCRPNNLA